MWTREQLLPLILSSLPLSDLDLFSSEERESVYVKEGQGAVLLCAPPPHYPGTERVSAEVSLQVSVNLPHAAWASDW